MTRLHPPCIRPWHLLFPSPVLKVLSRQGVPGRIFYPVATSLDMDDSKNMNARITYVAALAAVAVLAGCATPLPPGAEPGPNHTMAYTVLVESAPPGAQIEVNGQVVGNAPVRIKIFGDPDGTFHDFGSYYYVVRALPAGANQFPQARYFRTGHMMSGEDRIPQKIVFDMTRPQPQPPPVYYGAPYYGPGVNFYIGPGYRYHHW